MDGPLAAPPGPSLVRVKEISAVFSATCSSLPGGVIVFYPGVTNTHPDSFMPLVVSCRCGQRFAANEQLIGQQVPCPACGSLLSIGGDLAAPQGIVVSCVC